MSNRGSWNRLYSLDFYSKKEAKTINDGCCNTCCLAQDVLAPLLFPSLPKTLGQSQRVLAGTGPGGRCHGGRPPRVDAPGSWASPSSTPARCWPPGPTGCQGSTPAGEEGGPSSCGSLNSGCHTSDPGQKFDDKIISNPLYAKEPDCKIAEDTNSRENFEPKRFAKDIWHLTWQLPCPRIIYHISLDTIYEFA